MIGRFNEDFLVCSPDYKDVISSEVIPALQACREESIIPGTGQVPLYCERFHAESPRGTVLVLHGFTENAYKFSEVIYSLVKNNFDVVAYDQRGHGRSGRAEGLSHPSLTHVDRFSDYVDDLKTVCDEILKACPKPWALFCHSMGGAVGALFLETYRDVFSTACMCAPMIAPNTKIPASAAAAVCRAACAFGNGKHHPFFMKTYSGPEDFETSCASDPVRFAWYDEVKASREDFWNTVPTYRWTLESIGVTKQILSPGAPESIVCPVLLSTAEHDFSVMPKPQDLFINRVPKGKHIFVKGARHEIYRSTNDVFFPWWHENLLFLKEAEM